MSLSFISLEEYGRAFIPKRLRPVLRKYLLKAGYHEVPYSFYGGLFIFSIALTAISYILFFYPILIKYEPSLFVVLISTFFFWLIVQIMALLLIIAILFIILDTTIYRRTKQMEDVLEEFLRYVSENLKGGMSFDKALWEAIRPQYGCLSDEIRLVAKRVMTGQDLIESLEEFTDKYDSPMLKRSFQLIVEGIRGGSEIAYIIDRIESDIRETKELKGEMRAANTTYVIFLSSIVLIIAPALFGLSYNLLLVLDSLGQKLQGTPTGTVGFSLDFSHISIDPKLFSKFSIGAILVIVIFASLIIAYIQKGALREGLKYIPLYGVISISAYFIFRTVLFAIFGSMMV